MSTLTSVTLAFTLGVSLRRKVYLFWMDVVRSSPSKASATVTANLSDSNFFRVS